MEFPNPPTGCFEMLHELGDERIPVAGGEDSTVEILAVKKANELTLLVYNHDIPGSEIHREEVVVKLTGLSDNATAAITRIDAEHVNPKQKWIELGSPMYPDKKQLEQIEQASKTRSEPITIQIKDGIGSIQFLIPEHGIAEIKIKN